MKSRDQLFSLSPPTEIRRRRISDSSKWTVWNTREAVYTTTIEGNKNFFVVVASLYAFILAL